MKNNTLYVQLFAGPGCGKSTSAAGIFYHLKKEGFNAELIQEYAKDRTWQEDFKQLELQPYILGKQLNRQYRLLNKVDIAVTDSPILFSIIYKGFGCVEGWEKVVLKQFNLFNNLNIFLTRDSTEHPYNPSGRSQTEEEAIFKDVEVKKMSDDLKVDYYTVTVSKDGNHIDKILELVHERLNSNKA